MLFSSPQNTLADALKTYILNGQPVWIFVVSTNPVIYLLLPVCIVQRLVYQPKPCPVELVSKMNNGMS